jgi:hypothetical protein
MRKGCDRRTFLKTSLVASTALGLSPSGDVFAKTAAWASEPLTKPLPKRPLGNTGHQVTIYGLGGLFTPSKHDQHDEAVKIVNRAIDLGVNYIDTAAWYGTGASELNIGTVMQERRDEVFLASKSHDYTYDGAMALCDQSLKRLQTDYLDLYQHHLIGRLGQLEELQEKRSARQVTGPMSPSSSISSSSRVLPPISRLRVSRCTSMRMLSPASRRKGRK